MKLEYDARSNAAYLYLGRTAKKGVVARTRRVAQDILLDFNRSGRLIGIEVLDAVGLLPHKLLRDAARERDARRARRKRAP